MKDTEKLLELITREVLKELKKERLKIHLVNVKTSSTEETVLSMFKGKSTNELNPDIFFIGDLSFALIGRLVHCNPKDSLEEQLIRYLMEGKRVIVAEEGIDKSWLDKTVPYALRKQQRANFECLKKYQIEVVRISNNKIIDLNFCNFNKKVLYHEHKLKEMDLKRGSKLLVESNSLFTELAKDYLRKNDISVVAEVKEA